MQNYYMPNNLDRINRLAQLQNQFNQQYPNYTGFQQQPNNQIIFVQGETGAKAYQIPVNSTVLLMSSEANEFFIKTTDQAGFPTIKKYRFSEVTQTTGQAQGQTNTEQIKTQNFVTREEFETLKNEIKQLKELKPNEPDNENAKSKKPDNKRA